MHGVLSCPEQFIYYHHHQRGYVFGRICLSVCKIPQKFTDFDEIFRKCQQMHKKQMIGAILELKGLVGGMPPPSTLVEYCLLKLGLFQLDFVFYIQFISQGYITTGPQQENKNICKTCRVLHKTKIGASK